MVEESFGRDGGWRRAGARGAPPIGCVDVDEYSASYFHLISKPAPPTFPDPGIIGFFDELEILNRAKDGG